MKIGGDNNLEVSAVIPGSVAAWFTMISISRYVSKAALTSVVGASGPFRAAANSEAVPLLKTMFITSLYVCFDPNPSHGG